MLLPKKYLTNRFVIVSIIFVIWIVFIDDNSLIYLHKLNKELKKTEERKNFYQEKIKEQKEELKNLNDPKKLQKYAREKLLMKKQDEDIYIIEKK